MKNATSHNIFSHHHHHHQNMLYTSASILMLTIKHQQQQNHQIKWDILTVKHSSSGSKKNASLFTQHLPQVVNLFYFTQRSTAQLNSTTHGTYVKAAQQPIGWLLYSSDNRTSSPPHIRITHPFTLSALHWARDALKCNCTLDKCCAQ